MSAETALRLQTVRRAAMGATASVTTDAHDDVIEAAHRTIAALEARWSRFRPDSEVSRANRAGRGVVVDRVTATAVATAVAAHRATDGWFDPSLGREIMAMGYRHSLGSGWDRSEPAPVRRAGAADVVADPATGLVDVPPGIAIDLGGVGKGMAADLVTADLVGAGARIASVEVGGDIRVRADRRVAVEVADPRGSLPSASIGLRNGGIAVSGPTKRRSADGRHHLIDPRTGRSTTSVRVVVVVAATAAGAEILATAAAVAPAAEAPAIIARTGATAWLVEGDGGVLAVGTPDRYLETSGWLAS